MNIALIGAGNVATHLGIALATAGHKIMAVYSRTPDSREELAKQFAGAAPINSLNLLHLPIDLVILAVPDAALADVVERLQVQENVIVVHTSGSQPLTCLQAATTERGGVFYPLQTFSKSKPVNFKQLPVLLEAQNAQTLTTLQAVAASVTDKVYNVTSHHRKQLHLAAVFACNFTNHLLGISRELLEQANLPKELLHPLIQETIAKALQQHPYLVQTGPAIRHDQNVIQEHLEMLQAQPLYQELYQVLTQSIQAQLLQKKNSNNS